MYIWRSHDMSDPVIGSMAEVSGDLADVIDRANRDDTPTITAGRGKEEAVMIDIREYRRLRDLEQRAEDAWLNHLADEAEGMQGSIPLEQMAALLREPQA